MKKKKKHEIGGRKTKQIFVLLLCVHLKNIFAINSCKMTLEIIFHFCLLYKSMTVHNTNMFYDLSKTKEQEINKSIRMFSENT